MIQQVRARANIGLLNGPPHNAHCRHWAIAMFFNGWSGHLWRRLAGQRSTAATRQNIEVWMQNTYIIYDLQGILNNEGIYQITGIHSK